MPKHPRKRQRTTASQSETLEHQPLGLDALTDDAAKDDEELRLESLLFGTQYDPPADGNESGLNLEDDDILAGNQFENFKDVDLFYVDQGEGVDPTSTADPSLKSVTAPPPTQKRKPPAWEDPSDTPLLVSISSGRLRKLRDAPSEATISGVEYESRLRRQYERINPQPEWASKARKRNREPGEQDIEIDEVVTTEEDLLTSTGGIIQPRATARRKGNRVILSSGTLAIEKLRDANQGAYGAGGGEIKDVAFHPSDRVPVLCVASADRRVRLFNIDGHTNPALHTLHLPALPLTSATFHPGGAQLLLTGPRPFFYTHDLQSGVTTRSTRGLWGVTFAGDAGARVDRGGSAAGGEGMQVRAFSPGDGALLAVAGRGGYIHLVDWKGGGGQVVASLKAGGGGGGVRALSWGGQGRDELLALTGDAEVCIWDVGTRRCVRRWKDEGGFRGAARVMAGAGDAWLSVGSNTGMVNVYGASAFSTDVDTRPVPLKTIQNLTTAISTLSFNHDAQLMAIASREKKDSMRLIHLPSLTAFANWPTSSTPLGHVTAVDFSAQSEYLAIGNTKGRVLLYHLRDYGIHRG